MADLKWPSWRYHKTEDPRIFNSAKELEDAGPGWYQHWIDIPDEEHITEARKPGRPKRF